MNQNAQVSLEYLLVLLAFLGVFAAMLPFAVSAYHAGIFAIDSASANNFAEQLSSEISDLGVLSENSGKKIIARPFLEWSFHSEKKILFLSVKSTALSREKHFSVSFPNEISFSEKTFSEKTVFLLEKTGSKLLFSVLTENAD